MSPRFALSTFLLAFLCMAAFRSAAQAPDTLFTHYQLLNEAELRLADYKDDDEALKQKIMQLAVINQSRKKFKAQPVQLDILASRVANKMCREAAENNYLGHWDLAGEKPYHRYAFAGGLDHVSENAASRWSNSGNLDAENREPLSAMKALHGEFMAERAPHDGHKKNCIERAHNFVGIGFYSTVQRLCYYEEFIDRYLTFNEAPVNSVAGKPFDIKVSTLPNEFIYYAVAYYEAPLKPMNKHSIESHTFYKDYGKKETNMLEPYLLARLREGQTYTIPFSFKKKGLYYIHLYISKKEQVKKASFNTKGMVQASGIVVSVD